MKLNGLQMVWSKASEARENNSVASHHFPRPLQRHWNSYESVGYLRDPMDIHNVTNQYEREKRMILLLRVGLFLFIAQ